MIPHQPVIVHLSVTLVTHPVHLLVIPGQLSALVTAHFAHCLATPLAVLLRVPMDHLELSGEGRLAQLALFGSLDHFHGFHVEFGGQGRLIEQPTRVNMRLRSSVVHCVVGRRHEHALCRGLSPARPSRDSLAHPIVP